MLSPCYSRLCIFTSSSYPSPEDDELESIRQLMGEDFDPHFFDLRSARHRVDDFQRTIGEARWGFYHQ